nr:conjugal transfer protein TraN [Rhodoferax antarcticus]
MLGSVPHPVDYCVDATPCKTINSQTICLTGAFMHPAGSFTVPQTCWNTMTDYTCLQYQTDCLPFSSNSYCTEQGTGVCSMGGNGLPMTSPYPKLGPCLSTTHTYQCVDPSQPSLPPSTASGCTISSSLNGLDWSYATPSAADDFIAASTAQEFARQLVTYGYDASGSLSNLFHGTAMTCADGYIGLKNCCVGSSGTPTTNYKASGMLGNVAGMGLKVGATYAAKYGAPYVYDLMMANVAPEFLQSGVASMANSLQSFGSNPLNGVGMYGFGLTPTAAGGFFGTSASAQIGTSGVYFNPYALAAAVAIQVIMAALACDQEEMDLANLKGQNLCHYVGSYCSHELKFFGATIACLETTESYCCFNGLLAKGIMEGAHTQLGISWGSGKSPNCSGLSTTQIQALDLSGPAFTSVMEPFRQSVMNHYTNDVLPTTSGGAFQSATQTKATSNFHDLCLQKQLSDTTITCP